MREERDAGGAHKREKRLHFINCGLAGSYFSPVRGADARARSGEGGRASQARVGPRPPDIF